MKKRYIAYVLIISGVAFMGLKLKLDSIPRRKVPGSSFIYLPSGKYLKYATLGYNSVIADLVYIWSIQYFSNQKIPNRYNYLDHVYSITAELDPHYFDPYNIGALIAAYENRDLEKTLRILDLGLEKNPREWIYPWQAAHHAQIVFKDYATARKYYEITMNIEGAPAMARRAYANAAYNLSDYATAMKHWAEIYDATDDDRIKKIASNHIYRTQAAIDIEALHKELDKYKAAYGRYPQDLEQLAAAGYLKYVPKDWDGNDYFYDNEKGEVKSAPWWKR